jgi:hypothetical protein
MSTLRSVSGGGLNARVDAVRDEIFELIEALRGDSLADAEAVDALFIAAYELGVVQRLMHSGHAPPLAVVEHGLGLAEALRASSH